MVDALRGLRRLRRVLPLVLVLLLLGGGAAAAQSLSPAERAELQARKEALFQQMLKNPANLDVTFAYADISAKLGDNEAAVSALERMLLFNPNLPRVQLELGALYFRMGSYKLAQTYFEKALASNPPPEVRAHVNDYLAQIARRGGRQQISGFVFFGLQYQSDANLAPGSPLIHSPIGDVLLNSQFVKRSDVNVFATGSVLYSYDLGTQNRDTFEVGGVGFANHYSAVTRLDLGVVEATAGPRFRFPQPLAWVDEASLKPYGIVDDVSLGGDQYFHTLGVGGEATATLWGDLRAKAIFEFRNKNFNDAPARPLSRGLNGSDKVFSLFLAKPIAAIPNSEVELEFDYLNQDTRLAYYANDTFAGAAAYRIRYADPTGILHYPWETTVFLSRTWGDYDAPDPCCNTSSNRMFFVPGVRHDRRWRFGLTQSFEVSRDIAFVVQVQRDIVSSNLSLYGYSSDSVLVGPQFRF
jgi:Tetratricopeptide repeat